MVHTRSDELLLGEWACLGLLAACPSHGFAVSKRLAPDGDVGRVWSLSRALSYRAIDQLAQRDLIKPVRHEPGIAGGSRTVYAVTPKGRRALDQWLDEPVHHLRDVRSELLMKLQLLKLLDRPSTPLVRAQQQALDPVLAGLRADRRRASKDPPDPIEVWRYEAALAVRRFLETIS